MKLFGRLPEMLFAFIIGVVAIQLVAGAVEPYMGLIGKTLVFLIITVMVTAALAGVVALIRYRRNRSGRDSKFNG